MKRYSLSFGAIVEPDTASGDLLALETATIDAMFRRAGVLLIRGFRVSIEHFELFTKGHAHHFLEHGNPQRLRSAGDGFTISVTPGGKRIDLHSERAYSPFRPDIVWFYCSRPAITGGETVICDGSELVKRVTPDVRSSLEAKRVRYVYRDMAIWSRFLLMQPNGLPLGAGEPGTEWKTGSDGKLQEYSYTTSALTTDGAGRTAFACSLLDWGYSFEEAVFEDGASVPQPWLSEIRELAWTTAIRVQLCENDILMIDNSRFMHGRETYSDQDRRIFLRMACR